MTTLRCLLTALIFAGFAGAAQAADVVYLVRHAEKMADGTSDPELTAAGRARACYLAGFFADKGLTNILSTNYRRTRQTAGPAARALRLEVEEYDPKHLPILAMMIRNRPGNFLIVGHSDTVPEMVRLLSGEEIGAWDEKEYDQFFEIQFEDGEVTSTKHQSIAQCPVPAE